MASRARCPQACDECKRRKEKCGGSSPCTLCARRGKDSACINSTGSATPAPASQGPRKRRRLSETKAASETIIPATVVGTLNEAPDGFRFFSGSSGTLSCLAMVRTCVADALGQHPFVARCSQEFFLEDFPVTRNARPMELTKALEAETVSELASYYLTFTRGIFDLFENEQFMLAARRWTMPKNHPYSMWDAMVMLVVAVGAQERGGPGDEPLAEVLFVEAQQIATKSIMEPPTIMTVQVFMLVTLYLFVVCRRNAAFTHLGVALRAAQCIGLHDPDVVASLLPNDRLVWTRAWKYLQILDVSSCAFMGRTLATRSTPQNLVSREISPSIPPIALLSEQIDDAGLRLCAIAETILQEVYQKDQLTVSLAYQISGELRKWTRKLPNILAQGSTPRMASDADLPEHLCMFHLTGAYYWTIILLTRPFLIQHVRSRQIGHEFKTPDQSGSHTTLIDACINSAFRCLDATLGLLGYETLPKKLFLVNNTTLVCALVLAVASFGDFHQYFPLDDGLAKAERFLHHVAAGDGQAAHYAKIVTAVRGAASDYVHKRAREKLEQRSLHVEEVFGSVHEKEYKRTGSRTSSSTSANSDPRGWDRSPVVASDWTWIDGQNILGEPLLGVLDFHLPQHAPG